MTPAQRERFKEHQGYATTKRAEARDAANRAVTILFLGEVEAAEKLWLEAKEHAVSACVSQAYANGFRSGAKKSKREGSR